MMCLWGRGQILVSSTDLYGNPSRLASGLAISAAGCFPSQRSRCRFSETSLTTSFQLQARSFTRFHRSTIPARDYLWSFNEKQN
jgi:hypothetical protein